MSDNFLKEELEAEELYQASREKRRVFLTLALIPIAVGIVSIGGIWLINSLEEPSQTQEDYSSTPYGSTAQNESAPAAETDRQGEERLAPPSSHQTYTPQTYTPQPRPLDKAAFIADGNRTLENYGRIVELVTLSSSMSDSEKISRIKQAVALDRQYFNQATDIRGHLVWAEVTSGPYVEATEMAEQGVAAISNGLTFMNQWADDQSDTSALQGGSGGIGRGSRILNQFSQKLGTL